MKLMNLNLTTIKEERAIIMIKLMKESDVNENKKAFYRMMNAVQGRIAKKYGVETETHEGQIYNDFGNATIYLLKNGKTIGFVDLWYDFGNDPDYPDHDTFITVKWRSENEYEDHRIDTVTFEGATNELERTGGIVNQIVSNYNGKTENRKRNTRKQSVTEASNQKVHKELYSDLYDYADKHRMTSRWTADNVMKYLDRAKKFYDISDEVFDYTLSKVNADYKRKNKVKSDPYSEKSYKTESVKHGMNESYTIETVNEICATLKKDVDKISYMVNKYPDNYNTDDLVSSLIDIETRLYEIWR